MTERVARYVSSPTRIPLTGAASCRRDAVLTTSPATTPSPCAALAPSDTSASPVFTAIRILPVCHRRAEHRHHRIANELLHRAAERLELRTDPGKVRGQDRADVLGIDALGTRREPD